MIATEKLKSVVIETTDKKYDLLIAGRPAVTETGKRKEVQKEEHCWLRCAAVRLT
jgi:hypothetical protein